MKIFEFIVALFKLPFIIASFVISKILSYIMAKMNVGVVICRKEQILTPIVYLRHPETQRDIVLMGVMHIGNESYYAHLQQVLDELICNEHLVLYEAVAKITEEELKTLTSEELKIHQAFESAMDVRVIIGELLKVQGQKDGLRYTDSWIRTDTSMVHVVKRISEEKIGSLFKPMPELLPKTDDEMRNDLRKLMLGMFSNFMLLSISGMSLLNSLTRPLAFKRKKLEKIIIHERDRVGLDGIYYHIQETDVVSIWGAAHLPGMIKDLKKSGFKVWKKEWIVAYTANRDFVKVFYEKYKSDIEEFQNRRKNKKKTK